MPRRAKKGQADRRIPTVWLAVLGVVLIVAAPLGLALPALSAAKLVAGDLGQGAVTLNAGVGTISFDLKDQEYTVWSTSSSWPGQCELRRGDEDGDQVIRHNGDGLEQGDLPKLLDGLEINALGTFDARQGRYVFVCPAAWDGSEGSIETMFLLPTELQSTVGKLVGGAVVAGVAFLGGLTLFITQEIRRSAWIRRHKDKLAQTPAI
jgi:hypothetical protein